MSYANNTGADVTAFHSVIVEAIVNGGAFGPDFSDIFTLTATPDGSACAFVLDFVG